MRRGWPLLLGNELDKRLQEYIKSLRECGAVVDRLHYSTEQNGTVPGPYFTERNFHCITHMHIHSMSLTVWGS